MGFANRRGNWSKAGGRTQINHTFNSMTHNIIGPTDYTIMSEIIINTRFEIALNFYIDYNQIR